MPTAPTSEGTPLASAAPHAVSAANLPRPSDAVSMAESSGAGFDAENVSSSTTPVDSTDPKARLLSAEPASAPSPASSVPSITSELDESSPPPCPSNPDEALAEALAIAGQSKISDWQAEARMVITLRSLAVHAPALLAPHLSTFLRPLLRAAVSERSKLQVYTLTCCRDLFSQPLLAAPLLKLRRLDAAAKILLACSARPGAQFLSEAAKGALQALCARAGHRLLETFADACDPKAQTTTNAMRVCAATCIVASLQGLSREDVSEKAFASLCLAAVHLSTDKMGESRALSRAVVERLSCVANPAYYAKVLSLIGYEKAEAFKRLALSAAAAAPVALAAAAAAAEAKTGSDAAGAVPPGVVPLDVSTPSFAPSQPTVAAAASTPARSNAGAEDGMAGEKFVRGGVMPFSPQWAGGADCDTTRRGSLLYNPCDTDDTAAAAAAAIAAAADASVAIPSHTTATASTAAAADVDDTADNDDDADAEAAEAADSSLSPLSFDASPPRARESRPTTSLATTDAGDGCGEGDLTFAPLQTDSGASANASARPVVGCATPAIAPTTAAAAAGGSGLRKKRLSSDMEPTPSIAPSPTAASAAAAADVEATMEVVAPVAASTSNAVPGGVYSVGHLVEITARLKRSKHESAAGKGIPTLFGLPAASPAPRPHVRTQSAMTAAAAGAAGAGIGEANIFSTFVTGETAPELDTPRPSSAAGFGPSLPAVAPVALPSTTTAATSSGTRSRGNSAGSAFDVPTSATPVPGANMGTITGVGAGTGAGAGLASAPLCAPGASLAPAADRLAQLYSQAAGAISVEPGAMAGYLKGHAELSLALAEECAVLTNKLRGVMGDTEAVVAQIAALAAAVDEDEESAQ